MNWQQVCEDPSLQDLPFKIELNEYGQVIMSPASNEHGRLQMRLGALLSQLATGGEVISECSVDTDRGVKVADLAWVSSAFLKEYGFQTPYPQAPEICIEITSPSNSKAELAEKRTLYLAEGAKEVWVCDSLGNVAFYSAVGPMQKSLLVSDFPESV